MLIVLVILVVTVIALAGALALLWRRMRLIEQDMVAYERDKDDLEARVLEQLDILDAEVGAATDAERIMERAGRRRPGAKVFHVPVSRWAKRKGGDHKRITGVLIALALVGSAEVANRAMHEPETSSEPRQRGSMVATTAPVPTTALPTETPEPSAAPSATAPSATTPMPTTSQSTTTTTTTTVPSASGGAIDVVAGLQLADQLTPAVLGERGVPDLPDVVTSQVGNDVSGIEDALEIVDRCLGGHEPSPAEDCAGLDPTQLLK